MFTGIIEKTGKVENLQKVGSNLSVSVSSSLASKVKTSQSIAHNGICLTVTNILDQSTYVVTAVDETLNKTNFSLLKMGDVLNLERSLQLKDRLDGHFVQGHIDQTATCTDILNTNGSWIFTFSYSGNSSFQVIEKGSVAINGVSLTTFNVSSRNFSVTVIPYTYEHTNFCLLKKGDLVNLEFDIIGKYIVQLHKHNK